jgi:hypothetical protein
MDEEGNSIDVARHPQMVIKIRLPFEVSKDTMMRVRVYDEPEDNK